MTGGGSYGHAVYHGLKFYLHSSSGEMGSTHSVLRRSSTGTASPSHAEDTSVSLNSARTSFRKSFTCSSISHLTRNGDPGGKSPPLFCLATALDLYGPYRKNFHVLPLSAEKRATMLTMDFFARSSS